VTAAVALVALSLTGGAAAGPAAAAPTAISGGAGLDWGVKASWRNYIGTAGTFVSDGAARNADGTFHFPVTGGSYESDTRTTVVQFGGQLLFLSHCEGGAATRPCALDMTLSAPRVEITEDGAFIYARMASRPIEGGEIPALREVQLAALDIEDATPAIDATTTRWNALTARMTLAGSEIFTYGVGTEIDPVSFAYDGPGGKPAGEQWSEAGAPAYHREAVTPSGPLPRFTYRGRTADELIGYHLGSSNGISLIDRRTFTVVPGSHSTTNIGAFGSVAVDPLTGTVFAGRGGSAASLSARHWDGSAWVEDPVSDSTSAGANIGGGVWDPAGRRYLAARTVRGATEVWEVRQVSGAWVAASLGAVRLTTGLPAPLLQGLTVVPNGNPATQQMVLATWFGQVHRLHFLADGIVAEPLAQAPGVTANRLVPVQDGLYVLSADTIRYLPITGSATSKTLGAAGPPIPIPSPEGIGSLDTGMVTSDYERNTLYLPSHGLSRVMRVEAGRVRHSFRLPDQARVNYFATFLPGTNSAGDLVLTNDGDHPYPADALVYDATAPSFTTQPADVVVALPSGQESASATLTVATSGDPAPAVRWQSRVPGRSGWADLTAADGVSGQDGPQLTIAAGAGDGGREYRAIATSSAGAVASERATLDVKLPPVVTVQPESVSVIEGAPAIFKAMPTGNPEPTITWQQRIGGFWREVDGDSGDFSLDGGFLTVVDPVVAMSGAQFRARLRNEVGTVYTRPVTLTVAAALTQPVTFGGGHLDWGVAERWRCYVVGSIARGAMEPSGGVTRIDGTLARGNLCNGRNAGSEALRFPVRGGSYDPASGRLEVALDGAVRFWGHDYHVPGSTTPQLDTRFSNLKLVVAGGVGTLYADAVGATMDSPTPRTYRQVALVRAEFGGASPARTDDGLAWGGIPTELTGDGAAIFGSYAEGEAFDPLALDLVFGEPGREPPVIEPPVIEPPVVGPPGPAPVAPAPVVPGPVVPAPVARRATVAVPKAARPVGASRVVALATIACPAGAPCAVTTPARVKLAIAGARYTAVVLGPKRIAGGRRAALRVRLTKAAAKRLAGRRATVRVPVTVVSGSVRTRTTVVARLRGTSAAKRAVARR
jgi:hypothetical protein